MTDQGKRQNPGSYRGQDGREYRWVSPQNDGKYRSVLTTTIGYECGMVYLGAEDWPAAKSALDALIEQEQEEWVEIDDHARIKRDGTQPQHRTDSGIGRWNDLTHPDFKRWPRAYRKGRSVAQQESADLRDAARELVRTINTMPSVTFDFGTLPIMQGGYHLAEDVMVDVNARQLMRWMDTLDKAAKKLEGKL